MNEHEEKLLAAAWIERYERQYSADAYGVLQKSDINMQAWEELQNLVHESPDQALRIVKRIASGTKNEWVLENLGSGPLEDLIHYHGAEVIDEIDREAAASPSFVQALSCVWESGPEEVWWRVRAIVEREMHNQRLQPIGREDAPSG